MDHRQHGLPLAFAGMCYGVADDLDAAALHGDLSTLQRCRLHTARYLRAKIRCFSPFTDHLRAARMTNRHRSCYAQSAANLA
jgi:hypothetical protein